MARAARILRTSYGARNLVGRRVQERRLALNLLQDALVARLADLTEGKWIMTFSELSSLEVGRRGCSDFEAVLLSVALDVDFTWLLTGSLERLSEEAVRGLIQQTDAAPSQSGHSLNDEKPGVKRKRAAPRPR